MKYECDFNIHDLEPGKPMVITWRQAYKTHQVVIEDKEELAILEDCHGIMKDIFTRALQKETK